MDKWLDLLSLVDFISVGILLSTVAMNTLRRIESCVKAYRLNSLLLSLLIFITAFTVGDVHLYAAGALTLLSKALIIPMFLSRTIKQMKVTHEVQPYISNGLSLVISGILVSLVYASLSEGIFVTGFSKNVLQISVAVIMIGLFIMITRKKAITQVIGLLVMENGLFLAGFSLTFGMPTIIELGILFDMLMVVLILGIFAIQIKKVFASSDLDRLTTLKG
ncbi:MAG: hypothetical protein LLF86_09245 [Nitrospiraceae bacterium]|nr:hypothetical protein [Nitrospiraceae bacterium]